MVNNRKTTLFPNSLQLILTLFEYRMKLKRFVQMFASPLFLSRTPTLSLVKRLKSLCPRVNAKRGTYYGPVIASNTRRLSAAVVIFRRSPAFRKIM